MGLARPGISGLRGIRFWKLLGCGGGEGFTPSLDSSAYAILCVWTDFETARKGCTDGAVFRRYHRRASETGTVFMATRNVRGKWSGRAPFSVASNVHGHGALAVLTRASVRTGRLRAFWRRVPPISDAIGGNANVLFKAGMGERPFKNQMTFSIWPDKESITAFARTGAHAEAIRAVREGDWFSEELYARFEVLATEGTLRWARPPVRGVS